MQRSSDDDISALLRYGVSAELIGILDTIATTTVGEELKYSPRASQALNKMILCRNYGHSLWQLSHLLAAVVLRASDQSPKSAVVGFFWLDNTVTAQRFIKAFAEPVTRARVRVELGEELEIAYPSDTFRVSPQHVPTLAALLEFVVFVDPQLLERLEEPLAAPDMDRVDELSRDIQKRVTEFLKNHMQPEHQQRKARTMIEWLAERSSSSADIDDATVLEFWRCAVQQRLENFLSFNSVARNFFLLLTVLDVGYAARRHDGAASFGTDNDAGEVDPERLEPFFDAMHEELQPVSRLKQPPLNGIKFLTKKDSDRTEAIENAGSGRHRLALTLLRAATFGPAQNRCTQHLRDHKGAVPPPSLLHCEDAMTHQAYLDWLDQQRGKVEKTRACVLHMLAHWRHPSAATVAVSTLSEGALQRLRELLTQTLSGDDDGTMTDQVAKRFAELALQLPELKEVLTGWSKAFNAVNREGLADLPPLEEVDRYAEGLDMLDQLLVLLDEFRRSLGRCFAHEDVASRFEEDRREFSAAFTTLYGETP